MSKDIRLKKGLNINLKGEADKVYASIPQSDLFSLKPTDFHGLTPKLTVKAGDKVKAGSCIFFDKYNEKVRFSSPVSGEVTDVVRGAKRRILEVKLKADTETKYESFSTLDASANREQFIEGLLESGVWPFIRQKPFDIIANPMDTPKAIFISTFNTAPLAPDNDFVLHGLEKEFQTGVDFLKKLTNGKIHLNVDGNTNPSTVFTSCKGVQINKITGAHPAGNVGVQIHHIDPINKGDVVWYLYPQDVLTIARLFSEGKYDVSRIVALTGPQVEKPRYYRTIAGANIKNLLDENTLIGDNNRFISGDVLTGKQIEEDGNIGFYDSQVTVIEEGNQQEFLGWIAPNLDKFSLSKSYFSWLMPSKKYSLNTNYNGEERAYVVTGQYEKVLPMDIYPMQLIKACLIDDIDSMEQLGIYEISPEDVALCEFVCTSKMEVQSIIREGLDLIKKECS
ncbi:Na(+)-translocating NADH-quinone reductase subunit A [Flavobacteriales bacterium]|jgi:Na+-transporting NADH:ubiquinone oxidoreductase subunit A|nr:Na(+)-translocating NADH-quinone reductase subunit A [Flavobacteriales bacterium]